MNEQPHKTETGADYEQLAQPAIGREKTNTGHIGDPPIKIGIQVSYIVYIVVLDGLG